MRDDAILLPPPSTATHKIVPHIRQDLNGKSLGANRQEGTELLPILELDEPRTMFASYRHSGSSRLGLQRRPVSRGLGKSGDEAGHMAIPRPDKRYAMLSTRKQPSTWHTVRNAPYHHPVHAQPPPQAMASTPRRFAYQPYPIGAIHSKSPRQSALTLLDIKRRRSRLLDLREVALDLLEETSTVLTQLDKVLPKLASRRGNE